MAPYKRAADAPKLGRPKKIRTESTSKIIEAILNCEDEFVPGDLKAVMRTALAPVLLVNKADRHPFEAEMVAAAEKCIVAIQAAHEDAHAKSLEKQNVLIGREEHGRRTEGKESAKKLLDEMDAKLEACKEAQSAAQKVVSEAKLALRTRQKEANVVEKELQSLAEKKAFIGDLMEKSFAMLLESTSDTTEGKEAVKRIMKAGKEYGLDSTLMQTFPITCKKDPSTRSEFETMMLQQVKSGFDKKTDAMTRQQVELEPSNAEKHGVVEGAAQKLAAAEETLAAASKEVSDAQDQRKGAATSFNNADRHLYEIWQDMKKACEEQDSLADDLEEFKSTIVAGFDKLKDKQPEVEPAEQPEEESPVDVEIDGLVAVKTAAIDVMVDGDEEEALDAN